MDYFKKLGNVRDKVTQTVGERFGQLNLNAGRIDPVAEGQRHSHTHPGVDCSSRHPQPHNKNRFQSFAPESTGAAKWYVDGASYFWALSTAIEQAQSSIYILDWWLTPELYLRRPPSGNERYRLDNMLKSAAERGVKVKIIVYKEVEKVLTLKSIHTKHALEALHPNIAVFRHPDHAPGGYEFKDQIAQTFGHLRTWDLAKASTSALQHIYGVSNGVVLFWAHHEKLCLIDNSIAFMGGLDICFGRWDTSSHPIADHHPGNEDAVVFRGQDYNNARMYDFSDVDKWEQNQLSRSESSRMGWSDIALSLQGPIVASTMTHFVDRWNYIQREKYRGKDGPKYKLLTAEGQETDDDQAAPRYDEYDTGEGFHFLEKISAHLHHGIDKLIGDHDQSSQTNRSIAPGGLRIQLARSCSEWSAGHSIEHSIANAYIETIRNAEHFIYIENQFFITATDNKQAPVCNKIGLAMVDRIVRAKEEGTEFMIFVAMPAVPAFAGDLQAEDALGTRAIMEFQYNSINRGGHSILEALRQRGVEDTDRYIRFYNLRNYDRINVRSDEWDTVAPCYMLNGPKLQDVPWNGTEEEEMNAFVSEELYIHSKLLIADDRRVICGSANLNDRSQLGDHDSEIAVIIDDTEPDMVDSTMAGQPYRVGRFASSLRRYVFRKHIGMIAHQPPNQPNDNWTPVSVNPNVYDWGSGEDQMVADPLSVPFLDLWTNTARTNTEVFSKVFHNVPNDNVRTWQDYDNFFTSKFKVTAAAPKNPKEAQNDANKVGYGHVVREEFPGGVREVKEWLGRVRGSLVEMPMYFLADVADIAPEGGLALNQFTQEVYT